MYRANILLYSLTLPPPHEFLIKKFAHIIDIFFVHKATASSCISRLMIHKYFRYALQYNVGDGILRLWGGGAWHVCSLRVSSRTMISLSFIESRSTFSPVSCGTISPETERPSPKPEYLPSNSTSDKNAWSHTPADPHHGT